MPDAPTKVPVMATDEEAEAFLMKRRLREARQRRFARHSRTLVATGLILPLPGNVRRQWHQRQARWTSQAWQGVAMSPDPLPNLQAGAEPAGRFWR